MNTITVKLQNHSYPIYVGEQLLQNPELILSHITGHQVLIVTQANVAQHYLSILKHGLSHLQCNEIILSDGEQAKNITEWQNIINVLLQSGHERTTTLIALGGGVVGDVTGFAAACYQRGVNHIQIPTTLIAQVDSAIGGKTAVNHSHGKNMIGAFHQPQCVITDVNVLKTLPNREFISGLAEIIKYGLICDAEFFAWLENNIEKLLSRDISTLLYAVSHSALQKANIVSQDEKEFGIRSLLNFGHTFGHALETACAYQNIFHGEAVALGMAMAAKLSASLSMISLTEYERIIQLLKKSELLKVQIQLPSASEMLTLMMRDKKVRAGKLNLILLNKIGQAIKVQDIVEAQIASAIESIRTDKLLSVREF
jgi:3-dehydroquinate synthase